MFVTFEGLDGSGKTTQLQLLAERLRADGTEVVVTREPGGTELGEAIRDLVLHGGDVAPWAEAALYAASRAQHVEEVIRPALVRGAAVLCDRYLDSSVAYQGVARGLGLERVLELNLAAVGGLLPDLTFLLQLDPVVAGARMSAERDRLESEDSAFHARAAAGYRELASRFPERIVTVDGALPADALAEAIARRVMEVR
jgi:dTMP kinase